MSVLPGVGVLSPFVGGDYYGAIIAGINRSAVAAGSRVLAVQTLNPGTRTADEVGVPRFLSQVALDHVGGFIVLPGALRAQEVLSLQATGRPVILVSHDLDAVDAPTLWVDNAGGVARAVAHLAEHGHRRIAFAGNLAAADIRERLGGYVQGLLAQGLAYEPQLVIEIADNHEPSGRVAARRLHELGPSVTAVITGTDRNAIGLMRESLALGRCLPQELAVIGFDDLVDARYCVPSLSSIGQALDLLGAAAYRHLAEQGSSPATAGPPERIVTSFAARESCGCAAPELGLDEAQARRRHEEVAYLQSTLNTQYDLGVELLARRTHDPRTLLWLSGTPASAGVLGLWASEAHGASVSPAGPRLLEIVGAYPGDDPGKHPGRADLGTTIPETAFPPRALFDAVDHGVGEVVFVVPIRSDSHDWGLLAAVGRIQSTTPPGREVMNHSSALLTAALDHEAVQRSLQQREDELHQLALHDQLTGLPNRAQLVTRLDHARHRAAREAGYRYALLFLDLDDFKAVNDTLGHAVGDELLTHVGRRIGSILRATDTAARIGGDEFVILLDGITPEHGPERVIERLREALAVPLIVDGHSVVAAASVGFAVSGDSSSDPEDLLRQADAAMYVAKAASRRLRHVH